jgi:hypothetical protein
MTPVIAPSPARTSSNILKYFPPSENDTLPPNSRPIWNTSIGAVAQHVFQQSVKKLFGFCGVHGLLHTPNRMAVDPMLESRVVQLTVTAI